MYHEETVINGVLCHRSAPNGEWSEYTPAQLSSLLANAREAIWVRDNEPPPKHSKGCCCGRCQ